MKIASDLQDSATRADRYINEHLFDPDGLMYSYIDVRTGKPFEEGYAVRSARRAEVRTEAGRDGSWSVNERANSDPRTYWSYEDTVVTAGCYIEALVLEYGLTGDSKSLEQAFRIWDTYKQVYYASQVYGIGSFLRPYGGRAGGFEGMGRWMEPLGTDQAGTLLRGQYALWKHAEGEDRKELADIIVKTLTWYEQQNFRYVWYKSLIHTWDGAAHAGSYYLPAIAFAAKVTGEEKWQRLLQEKMPCAKAAKPSDSESQMASTFKWGTDLIMLADLLGSDFEKAFPPALFADAYQEALDYLAQFDQPGMSCFVPEWWQSPAAEAETGTRARYRPTEGGFYFLCGLAGLGYPGAAEKALSVLGASKRVPEDFTVFLNEDWEKLTLSEYTQLQARAVGRPLVTWYRNYWILRKATAAQK